MSENDTVAFANHAMLRWARERAGMSVEDAAARIDRFANYVEACEAACMRPTIAELRGLAVAYGVPLAALFLPEPPNWAPAPVWKRDPFGSRVEIGGLWLTAHQRGDRWYARAYGRGHDSCEVPADGEADARRQALAVAARWLDEDIAEMEEAREALEELRALEPGDAAHGEPCATEMPEDLDAADATWVDVAAAKESARFDELWALRAEVQRLRAELGETRRAIEATSALVERIKSLLPTPPWDWPKEVQAAAAREIYALLHDAPSAKEGT